MARTSAMSVRGRRCRTYRRPIPLSAEPALSDDEGRLWLLAATLPRSTLTSARSSLVDTAAAAAPTRPIRRLLRPPLWPSPLPPARRRALRRRARRRIAARVSSNDAVAPAHRVSAAACCARRMRGSAAANHSKTAARASRTLATPLAAKNDARATCSLARPRAVGSCCSSRRSSAASGGEQWATAASGSVKRCSAIMRDMIDAKPRAPPPPPPPPPCASASAASSCSSASTPASARARRPAAKRSDACRSRGDGSVLTFSGASARMRRAMRRPTYAFCRYAASVTSQWNPDRRTAPSAPTST
mmetsp:Transcript_15888/g.55329  ORF Transcript_15888/g.55329 Transcript_15888/m.55329 type:complete len:303 (+) Transcript_15888:379-1287(+)